VQSQRAVFSGRERSGEQHSPPLTIFMNKTARGFFFRDDDFFISSLFTRVEKSVKLRVGSHEFSGWYSQGILTVFPWYSEVFRKKVVSAPPLSANIDLH
jgi:hypothetical protein